MQRRWCLYLGLLLPLACSAQGVLQPKPLTWQETVDRFKASNPTLLAGQITIQEAQADEITAYLRPNPTLGLALDQVTAFSANPNYRPLGYSYPYGTLDYLHEREHKRELRLQSARGATRLAVDEQDDLTRNLLFNLRDAFVRLLLAKSIESVANETLRFYDREIEINRERLDAGAIAKVDFQRVELQRIQFQSDVLTSQVNVRTAKLDLLMMMRERSIPVDQFDIDGAFDFSEPISSVDELRRLAFESRPDFKQAVDAIDKAKTDHTLAIANGSTDPVFGLIVSHQPPPLNTYVGVSVSIPLRIFDRNQGEKARTQVDISRNERMRDATESSVSRDVDSSFATLQNALALLRPYKSKYLQEAVEIRSTVSFAYEHGAASLIDFLDAQNQYRITQVNYLNLVGTYLAAANQVNLAVGQEVIR